VKAADLGDSSAPGQILALLGVEPAPADVTWLELARRIDIRGLLKAPALTKVRESLATALIEGLATPGMCRWLIDEGRARLGPAMVGDYDSGKWVEGPIRTGLAAGFGLAYTDVVFVLAQKRLE